MHFVFKRFINCRIEPSSTLQTLSAYLDSVRTVLAIILQIPPIDPSTGLRIAYLLHLTGDVLNAIPGYKLGAPNSPAAHATLRNLIDFLDDLDQAWLAVLQGQMWDPDSGEGLDLMLPSDRISEPNQFHENVPESAIRQPKSSPPTQTDLARLRSLLFSGESSLEEWLGGQRKNGVPEDDVSVMLAGMGLLDQFDSLFVRTLDYLGAFSGSVAQNVVEPPLEVTMGCS